jgi:hypothetical protein
MTQPNPVKNNNPSIHNLVIEEVKNDLLIIALLQRKQKGIETYGTILQANNGRNALQDAIEELLDAIVYLKQLIEEKKGTFWVKISYCSLTFITGKLLKLKQ